MAIYRYCVEIEAESQEDAERSLVKDICANGWSYDLEGIEESDEDDGTA